MEAKMLDSEFLGDITALVRPDEEYNPHEAYEVVKKELIEKIWIYLKVKLIQLISEWNKTS